MKDSMRIQEPLISVIVPVYNVEKYLHKCVDSILNQTYTNLEIILVDDGSPDNCGKICDAYAQEHSNICVVHQENQGQSVARGNGLKCAKGKYITFVDSDDWIASWHLLELYNTLLEAGADISSMNFERVPEGESPSTRAPEKDNITMLSTRDALRDILYFRKATNVWARLYPKELFEQIKTHKYFTMAEDLHLNMQIFSLAESVACSSKVSYYYLIRQGSSVRCRFQANNMITIYTLENTRDQMLKAFPGMERGFACRMISLCFQFILRDGIDDFPQEKKVLWQYIKKYRRIVLCDPKTRKKAWAAALLSYSGMRLFCRIGRMLLHWYDQFGGAAE